MPHSSLIVGAHRDAKDIEGRTALMRASTNGCIDTVIHLLHAGADRDLKDIHGRTALHAAVINKNAATVVSLIQAGADTSITDSNGATSLDLATDETCLEILVHHAAILATIVDDPVVLATSVLAHCCILSASRELQTATTTLPLRRHHLQPSFLWAPPAARAAVVAWARDAFIAQVAATTQPFVELPDDCAGDILDFIEMAMARTDALHIVINCSSSEAHAWVRDVVTAAFTAAIAAEATAKLTPASERGDWVSVQDYLAKGADIDTQSEQLGYTALMCASENGHTAIVQILLEAGADKDAKNIYGCTALMYASENGHITVVQLLLRAGADKDVKNTYGCTALIASASSEAAVVRLLLDAGARKDVQDIEGRTALIMASQDGCTAVVKILLEAGANKDARNKKGFTALMSASAGGFTAIVQLLLDASADKDSKDWNGNTALDIAKSKGNFEVAVLLESPRCP